MLLTFLDQDKTHLPDSSGFNKIGFALKDGTVLHPMKKRLVQSSLDEVLRFPHAKFGIKDAQAVDNVFAFFTDNWRDIDLFQRGITELVRGNLAYFDYPIKLPVLQPISIEERALRWDQLYAQVHAGDLLLTYDTKSATSKLISYVDNGPWSHTAVCSAEKTVLEATTSGIVERPAEVYRAARYRLGLYRALGDHPDWEDRIAFARSRIGDGYSYRKAIRAGLQKLRRVRRTAPTPNDLPIFLDVQLVCVA